MNQSSKDLYDFPEAGNDALILIAEDSVHVAKLYEMVLTMRGFKCKLVEDGEAAVEHVKKHAFDIIVMDLGLPKMDGIDATRNIRSNGFKGPIIACTAETDSQKLENAMQAGFDEVFNKSEDVEILVTKINQLLAKHNPASA